MSTSHEGSGVLFIGTPLIELEHTVHDSVVVDRGDVHIDADDPDHMIRIRHTRGVGGDILTAIDKVTGTNTVSINSFGGMIFGAGEASINSLGGLALPAAGIDHLGHMSCETVTCTTVSADDLNITNQPGGTISLSLIHISEPTRPY